MKKFWLFSIILLCANTLTAQRSAKNVTFTEQDKALFQQHLPEIAMANASARDLYAEDEKTKRSKKTTINRDSVYVAVESPAVFPGGQVALAKFIGKNMIKPKTSRKNEKVVVKFVVERYGEVSKVHVIEGAENTDLSAEAIRVVRLMNYWIPAKLQGTDVASYNTVSIGF